MNASKQPWAAERIAVEILKDRSAMVSLALATVCPVVEFPATLGIDRAPLTKHGLIGETGMITDIGRAVLELIKPNL
jgi:hypothetical protein